MHMCLVAVSFPGVEGEEHLTSTRLVSDSAKLVPSPAAAAGVAGLLGAVSSSPGSSAAFRFCPGASAAAGGSAASAAGLSGAAAAASAWGWAWLQCSSTAACAPGQQGG